MVRLTAYFLKGLPIPSFRSYQELASQCLFIKIYIHHNISNCSPGGDAEFDVNHFLWTGDIDSEEENKAVLDEEFVESQDGFSVTSKIYPNIPVIRPTSVLVTRYQSIFNHSILTFGPQYPGRGQCTPP